MVERIGTGSRTEVRGDTAARLLRMLPVLLLVAVTLGLLAVAPGSLRVGFLGLAGLTAAVVYRTSRTLYIQLCLWLWFLTPLLRRLIDWRTAYDEHSLMLSAPYVAAMVSGVVLVRGVRGLASRGGVPFACALAGIFFGTVYGLTRYAPFEVARGMVNWLAPVVFAYFIYEERGRYEEYREAVMGALLWGTQWMSIYGLYQFFVLPAWDEGWMRGLVFSVFGEPVAGKVRVFSTMNGPAIFSTYLVAGLLLMLAMLVERRATGGYWRKGTVLAAVAAPPALVALGLTSQRSLWVGFAAGVGYLAWALPGRARVRVMGAALAVVVLGAGATQLPGIHDIVAARLKTFASGTKDASAEARIAGHRDALARLVTEPMGEGMGSTDADHDTNGSDDSLGPHDSTLLELLYSLGGPGTLVYMFGLGYGLVRVFMPRERTERESEAFGYATRAAVFGLMVQCLLTSVLVGPQGFLFWWLMGFGLAAGERVVVLEEAEVGELVTA